MVSKEEIMRKFVLLDDEGKVLFIKFVEELLKQQKAEATK